MGKSNDETGVSDMLPEPCFNELSVYPLCSTEEEVKTRVASLVSLMKRLKKYGFQRVRCEDGLSDFKLTKDTTLHDYCQAIYHKGGDKTRADFLVSCVRKPYLNANEEESFDMFANVLYCSDEAEDVWVDCFGLYAAYLLGSFTVSIDHGLENIVSCKLKLISAPKAGSQKEEYKVVEVINVSNEKQLDNCEEIIQKISDYPISVPEGGSLKKTSFTLPEHHGKKECNEHGKILLQDPYVIDILDSIDFRSSERDYIHAVKPDGIIEVRLHWTKAGYGLKVSTSASDAIESWWVAKRLRKIHGS